jgi:hypothetical protein
MARRMVDPIIVTDRRFFKMTIARDSENGSSLDATS